MDLEVQPGELFGLLGPNGAGKTTLIKILTTLLLPSAGTARVFGFDIETETKKIRRIMNMVAGGEQSGYGILTVREQLWMFSQFYGLRRARGLGPRRRADRGGRPRRAARPAGERPVDRPAPEDELRPRPAQRSVDPVPRRADARARRVGRPGRPRARRPAGRRRCPGRTVLLTTHYMAEADELCERIAIVDRGRVLAIGTPAELKQRVQRESIFRIELDRLAGGPGALATPARAS